MTVPPPRRRLRPPAGRPESDRYARRAGVAFAALFLVAATVAAAPPAPADPTGCGALVRGQLCLRGPVGAEGTYTATYRRETAGDEITVRLGYQRKNSKITAFPGWFGSRRTQRGAAGLGGHVQMLPDECIRGVMEHHETVFVTKWSCG
ncbi:hypothetical protein FCH28_34225 [Streptomyces piniterrae]|uniref:Uncharacterized protein n=1 Tax=Streptomyces piniterrae TaxID=2571125 RepID=A0A4U0MNZ8_9ACTN|nr:hypothetical protein [Streptomyces piniterrae]TJZ42470.1 hypothetical protein FCH28_34225 [Streptomyces piniterrae]